MIKKLYPQGKKKAFCVTYDDGVEQDIRFVNLLNKYALKGTFNLNSGLMNTEFQWTHESGVKIKRLSESAVIELYKGHEVASHTVTHTYMENMSKLELSKEILIDKLMLKKLFGFDICGFAAPFEFYSDLMCEVVKESGFEYARISEESLSYMPPKDYYHLKASQFHLNPDLDNFINAFISTDYELALAMIIGHSYDLDTENQWDKMEAIFKKISKEKDILPMTTIDIVRYLKAMDLAEISQKVINNKSNQDLWFQVDSEVVLVNGGEKFFLS